MKRFGIIAMGLAGVAVLLALGAWQMQRLAWKESILAEIEQTLAGPAYPLPDPAMHGKLNYQVAELNGEFVGPTLRVLVSQKLSGAGYRMISVFETDDGRRIPVDRGYVSVRAALPDLPQGAGTVRGVLRHPDEVDGFTPDPDIEQALWFARDVGSMSTYLGAENTLLILRDTTISDPGMTPLPVTTADIPNNHLQYAVTWFALALVWLAMTAYFLYRTRSTRN